MWAWVVAAAAGTGEVDVELAAWLQRAPKLAKKACRTDDDRAGCRARVEQALRSVLTRADAEEEGLALEARPGLQEVLAFARHEDTRAVLYARQDDCLERETRGLEQDASRIAVQLCRALDDPTCPARTEQLVRDIAMADPRDGDPLHNEIDAIESFGGDRVAEPIARLRARLEGVCAAP